MRRFFLQLASWCLGALVIYFVIQHYVGGPKVSEPSTSAIRYVRMIEDQLGVPPQIVLDECIEVPLYVDGEQRHGILGNDIDNPTLIGQETNPSGSVVQRYQGQTRDGKPLPDVVWIAFGRNEIRRDNAHAVRSGVQMIGYNRTSGATAFFESQPHVDQQWITRDDETYRMRGTLPWIDEPEKFNQAFLFFEGLECNRCHQADPFITSPFINAAKIPDTDESVVPFLDSESPYYVIGGEDWDMRTIAIEGNGCFDCHRVGMKTIELFMRSGYNVNEHMPPDDPGSLSNDYQALLQAWNNVPNYVEGVEWVIPPSRENDQRFVGEEYPHEAKFNEPEFPKESRPTGSTQNSLNN